MNPSILHWLEMNSKTDPRSFGGLGSGRFLFNDGYWYMFAVLQVYDTPYDGDAFIPVRIIRTIRLLGVVRSRSLDRAWAAAKKRFPDIPDLYVKCAFKPQVNRWRAKNKHKTLYRAPYRLNRILCRLCGEVIESFYTHDYRMCSCGSVGVDGGYAYVRRIGDTENIEEMP